MTRAPTNSQEVKSGVYECADHEGIIVDRHTPCPACRAAEYAETEEEESSEDRADRLSAGRYDTIAEREADHD